MKKPLLALLALPAVVFADAAPKPPAAPIREVRETYFGTTVVDPYRWLEETHSPEVEAWARAQDKYTRAVLERIPGRDELRGRISALTGGDVVVSGVRRRRERYFYFLRAPGWDNSKLAARDGSAERILWDPVARSKPGQPHESIDYFAPSPSGDLVAVGASPGGSEDSLLYVIDAKTARIVDGPIDRAQWAGPAWLDDKSFAYTRRQVLTPDMPVKARYEKRRAYLHRVGTPATADVLLAGLDVPGSPSLVPFDSPQVYGEPGAPFMLLEIDHGAKSEHAYYVAPSRPALAAPPRWQKLCDADADVVDAVPHGEWIYLQSHHRWPRYAVVRTPLAHPDVAHAEVVLAPERAVVTSLSAGGDGLYVKAMDGGVDRLFRLPWPGGAAQEIALPFAGTLSSLNAEPNRPGAIFALAGWVQPPASFAADGARVTKLAFSPQSHIDVSRFTAEEVMARSADGTMVPLSIVHKKELPLDGNNPTLLDGYGSYGYPYQPFFGPALVAWLERGGVFAVAHARGGGEFGEEWHLAGYKTTKQHTIDDFIAGAEYLVAHKWTRPARLAGTGTSAGGITIAGAITQRPDLFAAALIRVGDSDILRAEFGTDGEGNAEEYGTIKVKEQFEVMRKVSGYQRVQNNAKYPAVLLEGGFNDPRVPLFQSSKMAARLQAATASGKPVLLRVEFDAGHGMGSTKSQRDAQTADEYSFLLWQLGMPAYLPR